jgi:type II secretory pathway pseudopilin PulG
LLIVIGVLATIIGVIVFMSKKWRRDAEKAKETERILSTPIDTNISSPTDDLLEKYK